MRRAPPRSVSAARARMSRVVGEQQPPAAVGLLGRRRTRSCPRRPQRGVEARQRVARLDAGRRPCARRGGAEWRAGGSLAARSRRPPLQAGRSALSVSSAAPGEKPSSTASRASARRSPAPRRSARGPACPRPARTACASAPRARARSAASRSPVGRRLDERPQAAPAALDVQHRLILDQHHVGARHSRGAPVVSLALGPGQGPAVGLCRIGGREDHRARPRAGPRAGPRAAARRRRAGRTAPRPSPR